MSLISPLTWLVACGVAFLLGWLVLWSDRLEARHAWNLLEREVYAAEHGEGPLAGSPGPSVHQPGDCPQRPR